MIMLLQNLDGFDRQMQNHCSVIAVLLAIVATFCAQPCQAADGRGRIQGTVKSSSGGGIAGAYVKLIDAEDHLTFMVISQSACRYRADNLPVGRYTVQAIGNELQSQLEPAQVTTGNSITVNLPLTTHRSPALAHGWPGTPGTIGGGEDSRFPTFRSRNSPRGAGKKQIAETKCGQCHGTYRITSARGDRAEWASVVEVMRAEIASGKVKDLDEQEANTLLDYLEKNFSGKPGSFNPAPDPNSRLPRILLKGAAAQYVAVEYSIPRPNSLPHGK